MNSFKVTRQLFASTTAAGLHQKRSKAVLIDGKGLASKLLGGQVVDDVNRLSKAGVKPRLDAVLVGDFAESTIYVDRKKAVSAKLGVDCHVHRLSSDITETKLVDFVETLNRDPAVHGIIVQLPLPAHLSEDVICNAVNASKDVDGFSVANLGRLMQAGPGSKQRVFVPCTAIAVAEIIKAHFPKPTKGLRAVVAGRSHNVGLPIALILSADGVKGGLDLTTTICHRHTHPDHLAEAVQHADVIVSAAGVPGLIKPEFIKPGAFIVDVGITRVQLSDGLVRLFGDVDPNVADVAGFLTPVPGGVGPCTVACLIRNTVQAALWATFNE